MQSDFPWDAAIARGLEVSTRIVEQSPTWVTFESKWSSHGDTRVTVTKVFLPKLFQSDCRDAEQRALHELDTLQTSADRCVRREAPTKVYDIMRDQRCIAVTVKRDKEPQQVQPS